MTGSSRHETEPNSLVLAVEPPRGGVSSDADAMLLAEFDERITLEVGVHLDLVYGRLYLGVGQAISGEEDAIVAAKEQL
jgi:hypothetical protein